MQKVYKAMLLEIILQNGQIKPFLNLTNFTFGLSFPKQ